MKYVDEQIQRLTRQLSGACHPLLEALRIPDIEDLALNPDGRLWQKSRSSGWEPIAQVEEDRAWDIVTSVAAMKHRHLNDERPVLETTFPLDNSRFSAIIPPITRRPVFAIRVKSSGHLRIADYEQGQVLTDRHDPRNQSVATESFLAPLRGKSHGDILREATKGRRSVLYVGPAGAGKTCLADAHLTEIGAMFPDERVVYIEDTSELVCDIPNSVDLLIAEDIGVDMLNCVRIAMRLRPRRIVVGEVRGREAHALLKAWNTGHPGGIATVHADNAYAGLLRLESLVAESTSTPQQDLIAASVHLVVFIEEDGQLKAGRKVREIIAVKRYNHEAGQYEFERL